MGKPLPTTAAPATGTPASGDQANAVVSGSFTAVGQISSPFCFYGAFNVSLYPIVATSLTTTAATATKATVASGTNIVAGQTVISANVPPGATVASKESSTTINLGGLTTAQIAAILGGTDAAATFVGGNADGVDITVNLERSFDGGSTWVVCTIPGTAGTAQTFHIASGNINNAVSITLNEPEKGVAYRLNVTAFASGTLGYRISETGGAATTWAPST